MGFPDAAGPGGMPDLQGIMAQAMQMQQQMMDAQEELSKTVFEGSAGGGLVTARVTGSGELAGLDIKPEAVDPDDTETLADLVVAAVRDAKAKADAATEERLGGLAGGLPDMGALGGMFGGGF